MPSPRRSPALVTIQGALLIGMTLLLIQPREVPDPFSVGTALSWTVICMIASLPTLVSALRNRTLPVTPLDPFVWVYVACFVIVLPFSVGRVTSAVWLLSLLANVAVFYVVASTARQAPPLVGCVLLVVVIGVAVLEAMALEYHFQYGLLTRIAEYDRPAGWSGYPELAFVICIQLAILTGIMQVASSVPTRVALGVVMAVSVVELVFLYSRMAWVTAAAVPIVAAVSGKPLTRMWKPVVGVVALVLAVGVITAQTRIGRTLLVSLVERTASESRLDIWSRTATMIEDHPLLGVGPGNFQAIFEPIYNPMLNSDLRRGGHAHNLWLQEAAELGLVGAIAYVVLWGASLVFGARLSSGGWVERAAFLLIVAIGVRSMGDYMFFSTGGAQGRLHTLLWMAWGIVAGRTALRQRSEAAAAPEFKVVTAS